MVDFFKNSIDLLTSFKIDEEEYKNGATKKSLNRLFCLAPTNDLLRRNFW